MTQFYRSAGLERLVRERYRAVLSHWPVANQQLHLQTTFGETFVVACGDPAAPPLVLLHGSLSNAAAWMFDAANWSRHFRVYALDMIGEAGGSAAIRPALASDAHARWLGEVLQQLGIDQVALVGASLGGWLAVDFASRHPQRVRQLVLLYPSGIGRQRAFWYKALPLLLLGEWGRRRVRQSVLGPPPPGLSAEAHEVFALMELIGRSLRPRLEKIPILDDAALRRLGMPLLVVAGGQDVLLDSFETMARVAAQVPHAVTRLVAEAPHHVRGQGEVVRAFLCDEDARGNE
ncbi:alpha/beta fold hydrolase [Pseudomonas vanderleydeniana]|uniref:Alpha/beta hydrolase n=1 Tax=Pseudomonas vanderleydeniana TaxID=2745495 RepID=A0A9E6TUD9_9PSED|nr:alpha/beta hydrolase [Pseudomonas vanderleydeniana]QXI30749.1 alpha/beta hydrolase [Pseudomonas vanderleydeniana]